MLHKRNEKGFTLVEIIVVLLIIGILLAITIPSIMGYVGKARDAQFVADTRTVYLEAEKDVYEFLAGDYKANVEIPNYGNLKRIDSDDIQRLKKTLTDKFNDIHNGYEIEDIYMYFDGLEPKDYPDKISGGIFEPGLSNLNYTLDSNVTNHYISKFAITYKVKGTLTNESSKVVIMRINKDTKVFSYLDAYMLDSDSEWYIQMT